MLLGEIPKSKAKNMKIISSKEVLRNKLFTVAEEVATDPGGFKIERFIVRHPGSAVVITGGDKDRVLVGKQVRLSAGRGGLGVPAGRDAPPGGPFTGRAKGIG